ncbi:MAG: toll/interleukin-1 receptor domain-containing protein [bacterium]
MPLIFISYSSNDWKKVEKLVKTLRQERDIKIWIDSERILPGDDFVDKMKKGIRKAEKCLICLSPSFNTKPPTSWAKRELKMAILKENKIGQGFIIPVRIKKGGKIPEEIGTKAYADLSTNQRWKKNISRLIMAIRRNA